jgi:glycosyltransferase involved in cell wall biosynthesis
MVVDDASSDRTREVVLEQSHSDPRVRLIAHPTKQGPGGGIISGYLAARQEDYDLVVVVGGDNQMPLGEIERFLDPIIDDGIDYTKGNRFMLGGNAFEDMPGIRLFGNTLISFMTKIASGYYKCFDVVDGYTAISRRALHLVPWDKAWKRYGYPMDFMIRLNTYGCKVRDIPRTAIYLPGERQSQIKGFRYALSVSPMIIRGFFRRLFVKYLLRDFHPLIFFYMMGLSLIPAGVLLGLKILYVRFIAETGVTSLTGILCALFLILGTQALLFAMLFDMQESE